MILSEVRQREKKARDLIVKALHDFEGSPPKVPTFTKDRIPSELYGQELTSEGLDAGILALRLINNMSGVSAPDIDLYDLLHKYFFDNNIRLKVNEVIKAKT